MSKPKHTDGDGCTIYDSSAMVIVNGEEKMISDVEVGEVLRDSHDDQAWEVEETTKVGDDYHLILLEADEDDDEDGDDEDDTEEREPITFPERPEEIHLAAEAQRKATEALVLHLESYIGDCTRAAFPEAEVISVSGELGHSDQAGEMVVELTGVFRTSVEEKPLGSEDTGDTDAFEELEDQIKDELLWLGKLVPDDYDGFNEIDVTAPVIQRDTDTDAPSDERHTLVWEPHPEHPEFFRAVCACGSWQMAEAGIKPAGRMGYDKHFQDATAEGTG